jgi:hypothetical protein
MTPPPETPSPTTQQTPPTHQAPPPTHQAPPPTQQAPLAARQAALVAALVAGMPAPDGFDAELIGAARTALLRKRSGEVAAAWPLMAASYGRAWPAKFAAWAADRPPAGALRDGWDFARNAASALPPLAQEELRHRERTWSYDGRSAPRPRRLARIRSLVSRNR